MEAYSPLKMQRTPGESSPGMRLKVTAHARSASLEVIMDRCILQDHIFTFKRHRLDSRFKRNYRSFMSLVFAFLVLFFLAASSRQRFTSASSPISWP